MVWSWMLSVALAGPAPELPQVLERTAAWRSARIAQGVPAISADEYARVAKGEVVTGLRSVDGYATKKSYGVAVLDVPVAKLWGAINDESLHPEYTSLDYAELVRGSPCQSGRAVFQYLPSDVPLLDDRWWVTVRKVNPQIKAVSGGLVRELVWESAPDGSLVTSAKGKELMAGATQVGFTRGSWFVTAVNERQTLVEYYTWVDPGGSMSASLMNMVATRGITNALKNMEALAKDPRVKCTDA